MAKRLSKTKEKTIYLLTENSRIQYSQIGKKIRKSPQYARNLALTLEPLINPVTLIDYSRLSLLLFRVYFRGGFAKESELENLMKQISNIPLVTTIRQLSGPYDLQVDFITPNPSRFNKEIKELITDKKELTNYDVSVNVVSHIFPRKYLVSNQNFDSIIIGGDRIEEVIDKSQKAVLKELIKNPSASITDIAKKTTLNVRTILSIMKRLKEMKIIRGYKAEYNIYSNEGIRNRITLKLHNLNTLREKELVRHCLYQPNIVAINKTIGPWDIEIDVETKNTQEFRKVYLEIREKFIDIIQTFNYFTVLDVYQKSYIPKSYFE